MYSVCRDPFSAYRTSHAIEMFDSKNRKQRCDSHSKPCLEVNIAFVFSIHWLQTPVLFTFTSLFLAQRSAVQRLFFARCFSKGMACHYFGG